MDTLPLLQRRKTLLGVTSISRQGSIIDLDTLQRQKYMGQGPQQPESPAVTAHIMTQAEQIKTLNNELGSMKDMLQVLINKSSGDT